MGQVDDLPQKGRTGTFIFLLLVSTALLQANFAQGQLAQPEKITELRSQAERGVAEAQFLLGLLYHDGLVVPQDYAEALKWYGKATDQDYAEAQHSLGLLYHDGLGVPQDHAEAVKWFRKAADQGYAKAQFNLAVMYEHGRGLPRDYPEAARQYRKAADQGEARAQFNLGSLYYDGHGVVQDSVQAHKWFNLAAAYFSGTDRVQATQSRDIVEANMTPAQITEAQLLARGWRKKTK